MDFIIYYLKTQLTILGSFWRPKRHPKELQEAPKILIKSINMRLWEDLGSREAPGRDFHRFGKHFGCLLGDLLHTFSHLFPASFPSRVLDHILA